jgi:hypothetical protein
LKISGALIAKLGKITVPVRKVPVNEKNMTPVRPSSGRRIYRKFTHSELTSFIGKIIKVIKAVLAFRSHTFLPMY